MQQWIIAAALPVHRLAQSAAQPIQIRIHRTMILASYRKLSQT